MMVKKVGLITTSLGVEQLIVLVLEHVDTSGRLDMVRKSVPGSAHSLAEEVSPEV